MLGQARYSITQGGGQMASIPFCDRAREFGEPAGQYGKSTHTVEYPEYVREMAEEQARVVMAPHVRRDAGAAADIRRLARW